MRSFSNIQTSEMVNINPYIPNQMLQVMELPIMRREEGFSYVPKLMLAQVWVGRSLVSLGLVSRTVVYMIYILFYVLRILDIMLFYDQ